MINTAIAFVLFPLVALLLLGAVALQEWHSRRKEFRGKWVAVAAGMLLAAEAMLLVRAFREIHYWDGWQKRAEVSAADVTGTWRFRQEALTFGADGAFSASDGKRGKWLMQSPTQVISNLGQSWAVLRHDGKLVLLEDHDGDPDNWNKFRAFERVP